MESVKVGQKALQDKKAARLAKALRENLRKRKMQMRAREDAQENSTLTQGDGEALTGDAEVPEKA